MSCGFKINSNSLCEPVLAAKEALRDLIHTGVQIKRLTESKISNTENAILRVGSAETILTPHKDTDYQIHNPCSSNQFFPKLFSPSSYTELRRIVEQSQHPTGIAFFNIVYRNKAYQTPSGLHIRTGKCDGTKQAAHLQVGCLNLESTDDFICCFKPDVKGALGGRPSFNLCEGTPQQSADSARLTSKRNALYYGIKLVESTLPAALQQLIKLRSFVSWDKVKSANLNLTHWVTPTPRPEQPKKKCIPVSIDPFSHPPTFPVNKLVTPDEYKSYEKHLDTLSTYLEYLKKSLEQLEKNGHDAHVILEDNHLTVQEWFINLVSDRVIVYTLPACTLLVVGLLILIKMCSHLKITIRNNQSNNRRLSIQAYFREYRRYLPGFQDMALNTLPSAPPSGDALLYPAGNIYNAAGVRPIQ